jgi:catechol 2,3-dioxygenase-like lactoylglutathione lyase family enzyme
VDDAGEAHAWFERVLGAGPLGTDRHGNPGDAPSGTIGEDLEGTDSRLFRVGGYPVILLSKGVPDGPVARFLSRWGTGVHSLAWEVGDLWTVQNLLTRSQIGIAAVNIAGRHFFMHPKDTHGVLMEWTDDSFGDNVRRRDEGGGAIDVLGVAWVTAAVTDAEQTAGFLSDLCGALVVDGNPRGPDGRELTVDVAIGDLTLRLVTPKTAESPYEPILARGPRLCALGLRVADLPGALQAAKGLGTRIREYADDLAAADPSTTFGVPIELTG